MQLFLLFLFFRSFPSAYIEKNLKFTSVTELYLVLKNGYACNDWIQKQKKKIIVKPYIVKLLPLNLNTK